MTKEKYFLDTRLQSLIDESDAVPFDMNGLLLDDESLHLRALNRVLNDAGMHRVSANYWSRECVGHKLTETLPVIIAQRNGHGQHDVLRLIEQYRRNFRELFRGEAGRVERPGVRGFISYLASIGKKIPLVTSARSEDVEIIAGEKGLDMLRYFDCVVTGEMVPEGRGKPNPDPYLIAAGRIGAEPYRCVGFEDAYHGIESLHGARMQSVAVPSRFTRHHDFSKATYVVNDLTPGARIIGGKNYSP